MDSETDWVKGTYAINRPEAEIVLMTNSKMLCQRAMETMEHGLGKLAEKVPIKRLSAELYANGSYKVAVDNGPMIKDVIVHMPARFG
ncbi:MAG: hypothetical protein HY051_05110 [Candidatus Aenigmarchaeota archaeon]|nr:hypothetical protein [Candidatus Aenigmarchaeota archaeon]